MDELEGAGVKVSMDGEGRRQDDVFTEGLWRSVKHRGVHLRACENLRELEAALANWFDNDNRWKPR